MRENKFRVWDNAEKIMLRHSDLIELDQETMCIYTALTDKRFLKENEWTKMQYTGLKDKNGVEIYEGDKLDSDKHGFYIVVFKNEGFIAEYRFNIRGYDEITDIPLRNVVGRQNVIGNIYENPELLEEKR